MGARAGIAYQYGLCQGCYFSLTGAWFAQVRRSLAEDHKGHRAAYAGGKGDPKWDLSSSGRGARRRAVAMENPLAKAERGTFPLTLRDVFANTHIIEVAPETTISEVKELLRAAKTDAELSAARERLAQIVARAQDKTQLAAREAQKAAYREQIDAIARLEEQTRELESTALDPSVRALDYLDAFVLLHNGDPMDDDSTVSSHGLSRETIVGISNQDVAKGRERRRERAERARRESLAAEREAKQKKVLAACATAFILVVYLTTG